MKKLLIVILVGSLLCGQCMVSSSAVTRYSQQTIMQSSYNEEKNITQIIKQIDVQMITSYIQNLTSFGPRPTSTDACEQAGQYIYEEFVEMNLNVRYHNWSSSSNLFGSNIEATLPGTDPSTDDIYLICAHYDSVYASPGADDNGAGTAAVLATAEVLSKYSFANTIKFVTFSGEEQGLHGSRYYAQMAYENEYPIKGVLNADMMGYASDAESEGKVIVFDNEQSHWLTEYSMQISEQFFDMIQLDIVHGGYSGRSDHASFHGAGYDAIFYFEYEMNPHYHSSHDTIDNMNPSYATNVTRLIATTLFSLSDFIDERAPEKPTTPVGKRSGRIENRYQYTTQTIDLNSDKIYYMWDWGDDSESDWIGPFESGVAVEVSHSWATKGEYQVRVKAKDENGLQSDWSDPLLVSMPITKTEKAGFENNISLFISQIFQKIAYYVDALQLTV